MTVSLCVTLSQIELIGTGKLLWDGEPDDWTRGYD
jgi:hypothetical protein